MLSYLILGSGRNTMLVRGQATKRCTCRPDLNVHGDVRVGGRKVDVKLEAAA